MSSKRLSVGTSSMKLSSNSQTTTSFMRSPSLDELNTPCKRFIYQLLHSSATEYGMSLIILGNFALIIMETNIKASETDNELPAWMELASWSVLGLFALELIMRLYVGGCMFFKDQWNVFDFSIISADLIFSIIAELFSSLLPISLLRILRLAKVARISKVFRIFPELQLMVTGLFGAMRAIMWGTVLMGIALLICSVIAVQFIHPLNKELAEKGVYDQPGCERCAEAFQTVQSAALTFWQQILAGDAWGQVTVPIIEHYPAATFYFLGVFLLLGLALHNLILGVIVDVAQESRKRMENDMSKKKTMARMEVQENLLQMCCDMDTDNSGCLSKEELFQGYEDSSDFRAALADLDVQQADLDVVWLLMDRNRTGFVHYDEFVTELYNMRSSESQFMLTYIKFYVTVIKDRILEEIKVVEDEMKLVEKELKVVEDQQSGSGAPSKAEKKLLANLLDESSTIFHKLDEDSSGTVSRKELILGFMDSKLIRDFFAPTQRKLEDIFQGIDKNQDKFLSWEELESWMRENSSSWIREQKELQREAERDAFQRPSTVPPTAITDALADLVKEMRQHQAITTARLESIDAKVDFSLSDMQRMRASVSWSLPLPCQSVSTGQKVVIQTPANSRPNSRQQTDRLAAIGLDSGVPNPYKVSADSERNRGGSRDK